MLMILLLATIPTFLGTTKQKRGVFLRFHYYEEGVGLYVAHRLTFFSHVDRRSWA